MKKHSYFISSILMLLVTLISSCNDEDPCPTCFESYVTCKVDGKEWRSNCISNDPLFGCRAVSCYYYFNLDRGLNLSAISNASENGVSIDQLSRFGGATLGSNTIEQREFGYRNYLLKNNCIFLDSIDFSYNNYFNIINIDTLNYIIEGKFQFKVFNLCSDTIIITDGYFKTKFIF